MWILLFQSSLCFSGDDFHLIWITLICCYRECICDEPIILTNAVAPHRALQVQNSSNGSIFQYITVFNVLWFKHTIIVIYLIICFCNGFCFYLDSTDILLTLCYPCLYLYLLFFYTIVLYYLMLLLLLFNKYAHIFF